MLLPSWFCYMLTLPVQVHAVLTDVTVEKHNRRIIRFLPPDEEGDSEASSPQDSKELGPK